MFKTHISSALFVLVSASIICPLPAFADIGFMGGKLDNHGDLDPNFDRYGINFSPFEHPGQYSWGGEVSQTMITLPNGDYVLGGGAHDNFAIMGIDASIGQLATTYGHWGKMETEFCTAHTAIVNALAVFNQPGHGLYGTIVAAGSAMDQTSYQTHVALARYDASGNLDLQFGGGDGKVIDPLPADGSIQPSSWAVAIAIDDSERYVVAVQGVHPNLPNPVYLARYTTDGQIDTSFGVQGRVALGVGALGSSHGMERIADVLYEPGFGVVVLGQTQNVNHDIVLMRFDDQGNLDMGFGNQGVALTHHGSWTNAEALTRDSNSGDLIVTGSNFSITGHMEMFVARFYSHGQLDTGFGGFGLGTMSIDLPGVVDEGAHDVALDPSNGNITLGGAGSYGPNDPVLVFARLDATGALDPSFGSGQNGVEAHDIACSEHASVNGLVLDQNGDVVFVTTGDNNNFMCDTYHEHEPYLPPSSGPCIGD